MSTYTVAVFPLEPTDRSTHIAYLRDYNPLWEGCCLHVVDAESGTQAKRLAIQKHKAHCGAREASRP